MNTSYEDKLRSNFAECVVALTQITMNKEYFNSKYVSNYFQTEIRQLRSYVFSIMLMEVPFYDKLFINTCYSF